jgi:hypothetical protein
MRTCDDVVVVEDLAKEASIRKPAHPSVAVRLHHWKNHALVPDHREKTAPHEEIVASDDDVILRIPMMKTHDGTTAILLAAEDADGDVVIDDKDLLPNTLLLLEVVDPYHILLPELES